MLATEERAERIRMLRDKIAEIKRRLPKHTPSMAMMVELDEAEYTLRGLLAEDETSQPEQGGQESA
jgi:DNA-directed RNA polymerase sigma subunit (sigma70/sigma32)